MALLSKYSQTPTTSTAPQCKLLSSFAWSFGIFSFLFYLPTSVPDPLEFVSILQLQWSYLKWKSDYITLTRQPLMTSTFTRSKSWCLTQSPWLYLIRPSSPSPQPPSPLAVAWTCLHASTTAPRHSCFLCPHHSLPRELYDLLTSHFLMKQDFNFFDNNLILKEDSTYVWHN